MWRSHGFPEDLPPGHTEFPLHFKALMSSAVGFRLDAVSHPVGLRGICPAQESIGRINSGEK